MSTSEETERQPGDPFQVATGVCWAAAKKFGASCKCDTNGQSNRVAHVAVTCSSLEEGGTATAEEEIEQGYIASQIVCDTYTQKVLAVNGTVKRMESVFCIHENFEVNEEGRSEYTACDASVDGQACQSCHKQLDLCQPDTNNPDATLEGFIMSCGNLESTGLAPQEALCLHGLHPELTPFESEVEVVVNETEVVANETMVTNETIAIANETIVVANETIVVNDTLAVNETIFEPTPAPIKGEEGGAGGEGNQDTGTIAASSGDSFMKDALGQPRNIAILGFIFVFLLAAACWCNYERRKYKKSSDTCSNSSQSNNDRSPKSKRKLSRRRKEQECTAPVGQPPMYSTLENDVEDSFEYDDENPNPEDHNGHVSEEHFDDEECESDYDDDDRYSDSDGYEEDLVGRQNDVNSTTSTRNFI